jgi:thiol-disulfide isomerase/thioredoxin
LFFLFTSVFSQDKTNPPASSKIIVYIFLSETCPICQSYTLTLKELYSKYHNQQVEFVGVFPNYYSDRKSIEEFQKKYSVPFKVITDKDGVLAKKLKASITPEVFVLKNNLELYSGRIDDSFYAIGKRRTVITSTELSNALAEITSSQKVKTPKTIAVGCIISSTK